MLFIRLEVGLCYFGGMECMLCLTSWHGWDYRTVFTHRFCYNVLSHIVVSLVLYELSRSRISLVLYELSCS